MRQNEIKDMLSDIINNNAEYECRPTGGPLIYYEWKLYKLGEEIRSDYQYRKVKKWYVVKCNREKPFMCINQEHLNMHFLPTDIVFESNSEDECKKWIADHSSWMEKNYGKKEWITDDIDANEIRIDAIEDFVKEFLSRAYKDAKEYNDDVLSIEDLENIIKEMGMKVH